MARLTIVNDSPELLDLIGEILEGDRHVTTLIDGNQGDLLHRICQSQPELLVMDLGRGDDARHGWKLVEELRGIPGCEEIPVVLCSADILALNELEPELNATSRAAALRLPFEIDELLQAIHRFIDRQEAPRCS
jgi:CheY-like chemotaxis protein